MLPIRALALIFALLAAPLQVAAQTPPKPAAPPASTAPAAQTPSKPGEGSQAKPAAEPDETGVDEGKAAEGKPSASGKRALCRADAARLKGLERIDSVQLCMAQARVACVKDAIAKRIPARERKTFIAACMN